MKCKCCGKDFIDLFSDKCPFCGCDNSVSLFDSIFSCSEDKENPETKKQYDPYDWDDPDNCSDREYMDDDDYDDFDN